MTVYKLIDVVGTSGTSIDDAIRGAITRTSATVKDIKWFHVREIRGRVDGADGPEFQVTLELGFLVHAPTARNGSRQRAAKAETATRGTRSVAAQIAAGKGARKQNGIARNFKRQRSRSL